MGLVLDRKDEVLAAIYAATLAEPCERALAEKYGLTFSLYRHAYEDSVVVGLELDGVMTGGMIFRPPGKVHLGILPQFRGRWVRWLKPMLEIGFEKFGPRLVALSNPLNARARKFIEGVGCSFVSETPWCVEYAVVRERMKYGFSHRLHR